MVTKFLSDVKAELTPAKIVSAIVIFIVVAFAIKMLSKKIPALASLSSTEKAV